MIELLYDYLQEWRNKSDVLTELKTFNEKVNEREFRIAKEKWNELYFIHQVDKCLVHSNSKGYKLTDDPYEIIEMETDFIKRAKDMFYKAYTCKKARLENNNYSFNDFMEEQKKSNATNIEPKENCSHKISTNILAKIFNNVKLIDKR